MTTAQEIIREAAGSYVQVLLHPQTGTPSQSDIDAAAFVERALAVKCKQHRCELPVPA